MTTLLEASDRLRTQGEIRQNEAANTKEKPDLIKGRFNVIIIIHYTILNYPILIINKSQVKNSSWSKDSYNAHFWQPHINSKPKRVRQTQYQQFCHICYIITINDQP